MLSRTLTPYDKQDGRSAAGYVMVPECGGDFFEDQYGITASVINNLLSTALSRGGDFADLFFEYRLTSNISFEEDMVKNTSTGIVQGVGIRVIQDEQTGYAYTEDLTIEKMMKAANSAAHIANGQSKFPVAEIQNVIYKNRYANDNLSVQQALNEKLNFIIRANTAARSYHPAIEKVHIVFSDAVKIISIINSDGYVCSDMQPMLRLNITCLASRGSNRQRGSAGGGGRYDLRFFHDYPPEGYAVKAARQAVTLLDAVDTPAGPLEVVLGSASAGILLHEAVGHGLEADFNRKKLSNYSDRMGTQVASPLCTVVDNGTFEHYRGSINIDDEGHPSQENGLIEKGILKGYMNDKLNARLMGKAETGNGRRQSFSYPPMPRMTNTYLLAGQSSRDEIIQSVNKGIYAKEFGGGQVNITNGDFVFNVTEGYLIERGRITAPVKGAQLIGNGPDVMTRVTMVGNDLEFSDGIWTCGKNGQSVPVGVGLPHVKVSEITVGGTDAGPAQST